MPKPSSDPSKPTRPSRAEREADTLRRLLREARLAARLRQQDLAEKLRVPQSFVSKYESGERRLDVLELRHVCAALGLSFSAFTRQLDERLTAGD